MKERKPIPCLECGREKYFEGLCYWCKNRKERERYQVMSDAEIESTKQKIIDKFETIKDCGEAFNDFCSLLAYRNINTKGIADAAFAKGIFLPWTLYRNASDELTNKMIEMLLNPNCKEAGAILCCLGVNGGDNVREVFLELEKNPLPWRKKLYVNPSIYAECGGWTFDEIGNKIELIYQDCYPLQKSNESDNAVKVGTIRKEACNICGCKLVDILTLDGNDERLLFLGLGGKVRIPICPNCASMCEKTIVRYTTDGDSQMEIVNSYSNKNYVTEKDLAALNSNKLALAKAKEPIYYACGTDEVCTIGGHAEWIQDWQYETCPDCGKKMKLLSALTWNELLGSGEGTLYIEICTDCHVIAAFHQQT